MPRAVDWSQVEREYVAGAESLRELADRLKIGHAAIMQASARRGWAEKRKAHRASLATGEPQPLPGPRGELIADVAALREGILQDLLTRIPGR